MLSCDAREASAFTIATTFGPTGFSASNRIDQDFRSSGGAETNQAIGIAIEGWRPARSFLGMEPRGCLRPFVDEPPAAPPYSLQGVNPSAMLKPC